MVFVYMLVTVLLALSSTSVPLLYPVSGVFRFAALGTMLLVLWLRSRRNSMPVLISYSLISLVVSLLMFSIWVTAPMGSAEAFMRGVMAVAGFFVFMVSLLHLKGSEGLYDGVVLGLFVVVLSSLLMGWASAPFAMENERLRGILENANTLGFVASVLIILVGFRRRLSIFSYIALGLGLYTIVFSGSRGALVLAAVALCCMAIFGSKRARYAITLVFLTVFLSVVLRPDLLRAVPLLRLDNSRSRGFSLAAEVVIDSPWYGLGQEVGAELPIAGVWPAALAWGGIPAVVFLLVAVCSSLVWSFGLGIRSFSMLGAAVLYTAIEGWLLAPMGATTLLIFTAVVVLASRPGEELSLERRRSAVNQSGGS